MCHLYPTLYKTFPRVPFFKNNEYASRFSHSSGFFFYKFKCPTFLKENFFPPRLGSSYIYISPSFVCLHHSSCLMYICEHLGNIHVCVFAAKLLEKKLDNFSCRFLHWSRARYYYGESRGLSFFSHVPTTDVSASCSPDSITRQKYRNRVTFFFFFFLFFRVSLSRKDPTRRPVWWHKRLETFGGRQQQVMNPSS